MRDSLLLEFVDDKRLKGGERDMVAVIVVVEIQDAGKGASATASDQSHRSARPYPEVCPGNTPRGSRRFRGPGAIVDRDTDIVDIV